MKMFRKCLEKFWIVSNLQEKSEKVLKESSETKTKVSWLDKPFDGENPSDSIEEPCSEEFKNKLEFLETFKKVPTVSDIGTKFDQGKLSYTLLPFKAVTEVVKVLEFGKLKYAKDNWQKVPNGKERYINAALRHIISYIGGETTDPESGLHHLAHATCCLLFVIWFDLVVVKPCV